MKKIILFSLLIMPVVARAAEAEFPIPGTSGASDPVSYVVAVYQFALAAAGLLAFAMIVYAGVRYTMAGGNPTTQSDARDQIKQALLGVLLLLGGVLLLSTINPAIVSLSGGTAVFPALPLLPDVTPPEPILLNPAGGQICGANNGIGYGTCGTGVCKQNPDTNKWGCVEGVKCPAGKTFPHYSTGGISPTSEFYACREIPACGKSNCTP